MFGDIYSGHWRMAYRVDVRCTLAHMEFSPAAYSNPFRMQTLGTKTRGVRDQRKH